MEDKPFDWDAILDRIEKEHPGMIDRSGPPVVSSKSSQQTTGYYQLHDLLYFVITEANKQGRSTCFFDLANAFGVEKQILSRALDYCDGILGSRWVTNTEKKQHRRELFTAVKLENDELTYDEFLSEMKSAIDPVVEKLPYRAPQFCFNVYIHQTGTDVRYIN